VTVTSPTIQVRSLETRHPETGSLLLREFGAPLILRLGTDPVSLPSGVVERTVAVDRMSPQAPGRCWQESRVIGWDGLSDHDAAYCERLRRTVNEQDLTERAAIGVMFLLVHELEEAVHRDVVQIGGGGDYLIYLPQAARAVQVEVSGIRVGRAADAANRLRQKCAQVRKPGFASVTTFGYDGGNDAHSYLHYVARVARPKKTGPRKKKGKGGRKRK
jgi:hypothetical protein